MKIVFEQSNPVWRFKEAIVDHEVSVDVFEIRVRPRHHSYITMMAHLLSDAGTEMGDVIGEGKTIDEAIGDMAIVVERRLRIKADKFGV